MNFDRPLGCSRAPSFSLGLPYGGLKPSRSFLLLFGSKKKSFGSSKKEQGEDLVDDVITWIPDRVWNDRLQEDD